MTWYEVCVVGSFMKDLVAYAPRRPHNGETLHGDAFAEFLGGKGVNQAVAAARAGARTTMVGRLGADRYGDEFIALLRQEGIDYSCVHHDPTVGTGVGLPVVEPDGSNSIIIVPRANDSFTVADIDAATVVANSQVLVAQLELPVDTAVAAMRTAHAAGAVTILNPAPSRPLPPGFDGIVGVIVANEVEARHLTGLAVTEDTQRVYDVTGLLRDRHATLGAVLTLGARGAVVATADRIEWVPPHDVRAVDTVGAGDAFCGALAARLAAGDALPEAVRFANAAGALATTSHGAAHAMPRQDQIRALLDTRAAVGT